MASASLHRMSYDDGFKDGVLDGMHIENERLMKVLTEKEVFRDSMLGPDWVVIYTINGPIDLPRAALTDRKPE